MSAATTYPKALLRLVPFVGGGESLPTDVLEKPGFEVDREHLTAYQKVCGFRVSDKLPATYPHMVAFPLGMDLMTRLSFPFGVIGLVHVANEIEVLRPLTAADSFDMTVRTANLRDHERGRQFDVVAEATVAGEPVWHSTSTYLHRESSSGGSDSEKKSKNGKKKKGSDDDAGKRDSGAVWKVPGDIGRRYGAVSGDVNPIHLHPLSAKLFGFPGAIAHGMWVKARCLAALDGHLPKAYTVGVRFKLPMVIPAKAAFTTWMEDDGRAFAVADARSGKPHVSGTVTT
jgi:acyl dehydratase